MRPAHRTAPTVVTVVGLLVLTACAGLPGFSPAPAEPTAVAARSVGLGVAPELVLTVDGYRPAAGGAGPYGADGYSVVLLGEDAVEPVMLSVEPGTLDATTCPELPVVTVTGSTADGPVECTADGEVFDRASGDAREYAVQRGGAVVRVSGGADAATLRDALEAVRVPTATELDELLPPAPDGGAPVERGDLPPGDGAPDNGVGAGG